MKLSSPSSPAHTPSSILLVPVSVYDSGASILHGAFSHSDLRLLPGERVELYLPEAGSKHGTVLEFSNGAVVLTSYRVVYRPVTPLSPAADLISFPFGFVETFDVTNSRDVEGAVQLSFTLKDCSKVYFRVPTVALARALRCDPRAALEVLRILVYRHAFPTSKGGSSFAWAYGAALGEASVLSDLSSNQIATAPSSSGSMPPSMMTHGVQGWQLYDPVEEFARLGLYRPSDVKSSSSVSSSSASSSHEAAPVWSKFRLSTINISYDLCDSYPNYLIVPATIKDDEIKRLAGFRSRGRIPAVVYLHPRSGATLSRCAQPNAGLGGKRCQEDERLVEALMRANPTNNKHICIVDLRPAQAAFGNRLMGKGTEDVENYPGAELRYLGIHNIHKVRDSYEALMDACHDEAAATDSGWLVRVGKSEWLTHLQSILEGVLLVVRVLEEEGTSVLLHCSDGWDRTSQVSALVQLVLDPVTRTFEGFARLIEKEWLSFGHMFATRTGQGDVKISTQRAPIFLQFLDCIFQLMRQFPRAFEFTDELLAELHDAVYSGRFGTFLFNSECLRKQNDVTRKTESVWTYLLSPWRRERLRNRAYSPQAALVPVVSFKAVELWRRVHLRRDLTALSGEENLACVAAGDELNVVLVGEQGVVTASQVLERRVTAIVDELRKSGVDLSTLTPAARALLMIECVSPASSPVASATPAPTTWGRAREGSATPPSPTPPSAGISIATSSSSSSPSFPSPSPSSPSPLLPVDPNASSPDRDSSHQRRAVHFHTAASPKPAPADT